MNRVERFKTSAKHNLFIHRAMPLRGREMMNSILHPIQHQNRVNLFILSAGLLDMSRYKNLSRFDPPLHDEYDGNWREREIHNELGYYNMLNHEVLMEQFRVSFKTETNNFADVLEIKRVLHEVIMNLPKDARISPPYLLEEATVKFLQTKKEETTA